MFFERLSSISNLNVRKEVITLLVKLSSGWRELGDNSSSKFFEKQGICNILEAYGVNEQLYLIWSVDLVYENSVMYSGSNVLGHHTIVSDSTTCIVFGKGFLELYSRYNQSLSNQTF